MSPMKVPVSRPMMRAMGQNRPHDDRATARTAAEVPAVKPADRSISPSRSTKTRPIARTMIAVPWLSKLAKLTAEKKTSGRRTLKSTTSTMRPSTAGREPTSPPLTRTK